MKNGKEWLTAKEVAGLLGMSETTINNWRHRTDSPGLRLGMGPSWHRFGRCVRYKRADVESYIKSCRHNPGAYREAD